MATVHVELVSVERLLWSGEATMVIARTTEGELGVLPGHAPLLGELAPGGVVRIRQVDDKSRRCATCAKGRGPLPFQEIRPGQVMQRRHRHGSCSEGAAQLEPGNQTEGVAHPAGQEEAAAMVGHRELQRAADRPGRVEERFRPRRDEQLHLPK